MSQGFTKGIPVDTDATMSANSAFLVPSQSAVRAYVGSYAGAANNSAALGGIPASSYALKADIIPSATTANLAYDQANTARTGANTVGGYANSAYGAANLAWAQANTAQTTGVAAFAKANSAIPVASDSPPGSPFDNQFWFDSSSATLRIYYNDGDTAQWVDTIPLGSNTGFAISEPNIISANSTLSLDDVENTIFANSTSDIYITIPPNANVAMPLGAKVKIYRRGTGRVKITPDTGVTFRLPTGIAPKRPIGCRAKHSADRTVNWGTPTAVPWDTDVFDTDGFHDTSVNTERMTIPSGLGIKKVNLIFYTDATNITSYLSQLITKNGTANTMAICLNNVTFSNFAGTADTGIISVADGDYFLALTDAGTDTSIVFRGTTNGGSWFEIKVVEIDPQGWISYQDGVVEIQQIATNEWIVSDQSGLG